MNKIFKAVYLLGNAAEIIIAGSVLADLIIKIRGEKKIIPTSNNPTGEESPDPEPTPMAA